MLQLKLMGQFEVAGPGGRIALSSSKLSALLAYLALAVKPVPRDEIATVLWGSHFDEQARQNLRQALVRLRKSLDGEGLIADDNGIQLAAGAARCDVIEFERLAGSSSADDLRAAVALLDGELMAGTDIKEPVWEDWLGNQRRRLGSLACDTLVRLAGVELEDGRAAEALQHAEAATRRDYLREDAHRLAMRALAALGRSSEALRHYQSLAEHLAKELQTHPEAATAEVFEKLHAPVRAPAQAAAEAPSSVPLPQAMSSTKPSIAVLAFVNLSNDPEQEFFADGISEDLITEISKFRSLFVISRNSTFSFKNQSVSLKELSAKLGARYIVEGSVRRSGDRLRITAKLVDAVEDLHLWAEHYDRELKDIFAVQDEVVRAIVSTIEPRLLTSERNRAMRKPPENLDAWEAYQRGLWQMFRYRREDRDQTIALFRRATALDPGFASAHAGLALALYVYVLLGCSPDRDGDIHDAVAAANTAIELDEFDPFGYAALTRCHIVEGQHETALFAADKAIRLNPSFAMAHFGRGHALWHQGRPEEALGSIDEAMRLSPRDPAMWAYMASRAIALALSGDPEQAIHWSRLAQQQNNAAIFAHVGEICGLGLLERSGETADAIMRARRNMADVSVSFFDRVLPVTDPPARETLLRGLRQAGLPE